MMINHLKKLNKSQNILQHYIIFKQKPVYNSPKIIPKVCRKTRTAKKVTRWWYILQYNRYAFQATMMLTLKAPRKKCIWKCGLLKSSAANNCLTLLTNWVKKKTAWTQNRLLLYRSSLIWVHTVWHRGFLNISADEKSRRLLLWLAH